MTITIDVPPEILRRLRISAAIKGKKLENVVEQIVERSVPTLDEAAVPLRDAIDETGMSDEEVEHFFDEVLHEVRAEKRLINR